MIMIGGQHRMPYESLKERSSSTFIVGEQVGKLVSEYKVGNTYERIEN